MHTRTHNTRKPEFHIASVVALTIFMAVYWPGHV